MKIIILLLLVTSCSVKHKINTPQALPPVAVGPDFAGAAAFCDQRYGEKTPESEACFKDFREYFKLEVSLDLAEIKEYCETKYQTDTEIDACEGELIQMFTLFGKKQ